MEIKPCPFCGHQPETSEDSLLDSLHPCGTWEDPYRVWVFVCNENEGGCSASVLGDSREAALNAWNKRV